MSDNYYEILGLTKSKTYTDLEIKKAYKKAALKWHPDRNPNNRKTAEIKFKDINEANQILSDPEKRDMYDKYGKNGINMNNNNNPFFGSTNFNQFFSHNDFSFHTNSGFNKPINDINYNVQLTIEELFTGCIKKLKITYNSSDVFNNTPKTKIFTIKTKPGWKSGTKIKYNYDNRTIIFTIVEKKHKYFKRIDNDLQWICILTQKQITKGVIITITPIDKTAEIKISTKNKNIKNGDKITITSQGMPIKNTTNRGNLYIVFNII